MSKELGITIGREDCGCYSLATKGHKTRYPLDGLTLIQIITGWIKKELHKERVNGQKKESP